MAKNMSKRYSQDELDEMEEFDDTDDFEDEDEEPEEEELPEDYDHELTFEDIRDADDASEDKMYIKEWGGFIKLRGLSKNEFDQMRRRSRSSKVRGRSSDILEQEIVLSGVVSPRLDAAKYQILLEKSAGVILRIQNAILEKSGLSEEAEKARERRFPRR